MFRFANPEYLHALWILPALAGLFYLYYINKKKLLKKFADKDLHKSLFGTKSYFKEFFKFGLILLTIALLIFTAARPQSGSKLEEVKQAGIDVYILLDVSMSMKAEDLKPNRLESAKNEISALVRRLRGDRIGLVIFAGQAFVQFPLTTDYSAAKLFLDAVDENSVPQQGTAIASAIELAVNSFDYEAETQKVIVIITDGEDHQGDIAGALEKAEQQKVMIYTIGMGSESGAPIPIYNNRGQKVDFKRDNAGEVVLTKLDAETLENIAESSGGKFYQASGYQNELDVIYEDLSQIEETEYGARKIAEYEDKYYYFLIPALLLLLLELIVSDKKSRLFPALFGENRE